MPIRIFLYGCLILTMLNYSRPLPCQTMTFAMVRANSKKRVVQCIHNSLATAQEWRRKGVKQMWKNQVDAASMPREFDSKQMSESPSKMEGEGVYLDNLSEQVGPQRVFAEAQPSTPVSMAAYTEAVTEFTKNATAFIEHVPLLTKARDEYDKAMKASAEVRKVLDKGEDDLRALMHHLIQVLNSNVTMVAPDKKRLELAQLETVKGAADKGTSGLKAIL